MSYANGELASAGSELSVLEMSENDAASSSVGECSHRCREYRQWEGVGVGTHQGIARSEEEYESEDF